MIKAIDAELKLVIAGNHDLTLDTEYRQKKLTVEEDKESQNEAREIWTGDEARAAGATYLDEGLYQFTLKSGAHFSIYASPYTPEFCNWGFPYSRKEDRFNPVGCDDVGPNIKNIASNPVPDHPRVDILMTHGPPKRYLDMTFDRVNVGCQSLLVALKRSKPRLHCFGHIHEGWGAKILEWSQDADAQEKVVFSQKSRSPPANGQYRSEHLDIRQGSQTAVEHGKQTLLVNAAIMNMKYAPVNSPWIVDMDLLTK